MNRETIVPRPGGHAAVVRGEGGGRRGGGRRGEERGVEEEQAEPKDEEKGGRDSERQRELPHPASRWKRRDEKEERGRKGVVGGRKGERGSETHPGFRREEERRGSYISERTAANLLVKKILPSIDEEVGVRSLVSSSEKKGEIHLRGRKERSSEADATAA